MIAAALPHGVLLMFEVTILVIAIFLGFEVISKVPTLLYTPRDSCGHLLLAGDARKQEVAA